MERTESDRGKNKRVQAEHDVSDLSAAPGDVIFSHERIPHPGTILTGFSPPKYDSYEFEPFFDFKKVQELLEFLEYVVLTERLILPVVKILKEHNADHE